MTGRVQVSSYAVSPVLLGRGGSFSRGLYLAAPGYDVIASTAGERATHLRASRRDDWTKA